MGMGLMLAGIALLFIARGNSVMREAKKRNEWHWKESKSYARTYWAIGLIGLVLAAVPIAQSVPPIFFGETAITILAFALLFLPVLITMWFDSRNQKEEG